MREFIERIAIGGSAVVFSLLITVIGSSQIEQAIKVLNLPYSTVLLLYAGLAVAVVVLGNLVHAYLKKHLGA